MPKAKGHEIKVIRKNRDLLYLDLYHESKRKRGTIPVSAVVALMDGKRETVESNLGPGMQPVALKEFADGRYLPFSARPRLGNDRSYAAEADLVRAVCEELGSRPLHEIHAREAEALKEGWLKDKRANSTIKKRLNCLRRMMDYAVSRELIRQNPIPPVRGLPVGNRSGIWLKLCQIGPLLEACHPVIRDLVEYMILTGARLGEALDFRIGDIRDGKLYVPTEKQGKPMREAMRVLDVASLGPRFAAFVSRLKPHPKSEYYFYANPDSLDPLSVPYAERRFKEARNAVGLRDIRLHDLRGTFAMHRAMVVPNFRQLQAELGHSDPQSVQSYLERAKQFDPKESTFFGAQIGEGKTDAWGV